MVEYLFGSQPLPLEFPLREFVPLELVLVQLPPEKAVFNVHISDTSYNRFCDIHDNYFLESWIEIKGSLKVKKEWIK